MTTTAYAQQPPRLADRVRLGRSRGAVSGIVLVLLGIWGGLVPFVGPAFGYSYGSDQTWYLTTGRFWLEILPAIAVVLGGLLLLVSANRLVALLGAWLAVAGGAWFVVGPVVSALWNDGASAVGQPLGPSTVEAVAQDLGFFVGLGVVILIVASVALGRMSMVGLRDLRRIEEQRRIEEAAVVGTEPVERVETVERVEPVEPVVPPEDARSRAVPTPEGETTQASTVATAEPVARDVSSREPAVDEGIDEPQPEGVPRIGRHSAEQT